MTSLAPARKFEVAGALDTADAEFPAIKMSFDPSWPPRSRASVSSFYRQNWWRHTRKPVTSLAPAMQIHSSRPAVTIKMGLTETMTSPQDAVTSKKLE